MLPDRYARQYLEQAPSLIWLIGANLVAVLVGVRYYVETMPAVHTFLWPLYLDSPTAVLLMALSLTTLLPLLGTDLKTATRNKPLAYLHTLAFVWLVYVGLWTGAAIVLGWDVYFGGDVPMRAQLLTLGIILTHLLFVIEAFLIPYYGETTPGALVTAGILLGINLVVDYGLGYYPPLEYDPGLSLMLVSLTIAVLALLLARSMFRPFRASAPPESNGDALSEQRREV